MLSQADAGTTFGFSMDMLDSKSDLNDEDSASLDDNAVKMEQDSDSSISSLGLQEMREINEANSTTVIKIAKTGLKHNHS